MSVFVTVKKHRHCLFVVGLCSSFFCTTQASMWQSLVGNRLCYHAVDFAQYFVQRAVDPVGLLTQRLGINPQVLTATVGNTAQGYLDCVEQFQDAKLAWSYFRGPNTFLDRLSSTTLGRLCLSPALSMAANIAKSPEPARILHTIVAKKVAQYLAPAPVGNSKNVDDEKDPYENSYFGTVRNWVKIGRDFDDISRAPYVRTVFPYVYAVAYAPEIVGKLVGKFVSGAIMQAKQDLGIQGNTTSSIVLDYAAEQAENNMPLLVSLALGRMPQLGAKLPSKNSLLGACAQHSRIITGGLVTAVLLAGWKCIHEWKRTTQTGAAFLGLHANRRS